jgi:hypothetical protein
MERMMYITCNTDNEVNTYTKTVSKGANFYERFDPVAEWNGMAERLGKDPDEETLITLVGIYNGGGAYTWEHIPIDEIKPGDPLRLSRVTHRPSVMGMTPINPDGENHE